MRGGGQWEGGVTNARGYAKSMLLFKVHTYISFALLRCHDFEKPRIASRTVSHEPGKVLPSLVGDNPRPRIAVLSDLPSVGARDAHVRGVSVGAESRRMDSAL